jgi:hypothetical protein
VGRLIVAPKLGVGEGAAAEQSVSRLAASYPFRRTIAQSGMILEPGPLRFQGLHQLIEMPIGIIDTHGGQGVNASKKLWKPIGKGLVDADRQDPLAHKVSFAEFPIAPARADGMRARQPHDRIATSDEFADLFLPFLAIRQIAAVDLHVETAVAKIVCDLVSQMRIRSRVADENVHLLFDAGHAIALPLIGLVTGPSLTRPRPRKPRALKFPGSATVLNRPRWGEWTVHQVRAIFKARRCALGNRSKVGGSGSTK